MFYIHCLPSDYALSHLPLRIHVQNLIMYITCSHVWYAKITVTAHSYTYLKCLSSFLVLDVPQHDQAIRAAREEEPTVGHETATGEVATSLYGGERKKRHGMNQHNLTGITLYRHICTSYNTLSWLK